MASENRKSHLAPQLSPATQELLRGTDSPTYLTQTEQTPTSGEIPILGTLVSPRDQYGSVPSRSPTRGPGGSSRPSGPSVHSGLGPRVTSSNSVPRYAQQAPAEERPVGASGSQSASRHVFSLPIRPAAPAAPLPLPPSRRQGSGDDIKKDNRRQAAITPALNGTH